MALAGTIAADFSEFVAECAKADAGLAAIEGEAQKAEAAVATISAPATTAGLATMGTTATQSASGLTQLSTGLKTADKTLGAFGVSVSKEIGMLDELGQLAGKTTADVGALGTAFSVAGAALAGWQIGRKIAELTGADQAVADFASTLLGTGSVAAETYAAKLDTIRKAILDGYQGIPTYTQAVEYNTKAAAANAAQHVTTAARVIEWTRELQAATGGAAALRGEIEAGNLTVAEMTARFNVSAAAIDYLKRNMALAKEETEAKASADAAAAKAAQAHADAMQKLRDSMFGTDLITKAQDAITAIGGIAGVSRMATEQQTALNKTISEAIDSLTRAGSVGTGAMNEIYVATLPLPPIVTGLGTEWTSVGVKVTATADTIVADLKRMGDETKAYEAETQRMADEWNKPTARVDETTAAVGRLSVQMQDLGRVNRTVWEEMASGMELMDAYRRAGVATGTQIGLGGYNFQRQLDSGVMPTSAAAAASTLNVNVNNADAQGIANKLVTEMRHQGIRF